VRTILPEHADPQHPLHEPDLGGPEEGAPEEHFSVSDGNSANWAVARVAEIQADLARDQAIRDEQVRVADEWLEGRKRGAYYRIQRWTEPVEAFARSAISLEKVKPRSISLPNGSLSLRLQVPKFDYEEDELLAWLQANAPDLVRQKPAPPPEPDKDGLKKVVTLKGEVPILTATGELIEGVKVSYPEPTFSLKTTEGKVDLKEVAKLAGLHNGSAE